MDLLIAIIVALLLIALIGYGGVAIGSNLLWLLVIIVVVAFIIWLLRRPRV